MTNRLIFSLCLTLGLGAIAATPTYKTLSAGGNPTTGATVIFPADPTTQIRMVNVSWQSDSNSATLNYYTGGAAYVVAATNAAADTNITLTATNGLVANDVVIIQLPSGQVTNKTVLSVSSNYVSLTAAIGVILPLKTELYRLGSVTTVFAGATTNAANGEAIFVGDPGRPVLIQLTPSNTTNRLSASARYM